MPVGVVTNKLQPRKFYRNERCSGQCSVGPGRLPGEMADIVHGWFEAGHNNETIMALAAKVNTKLSNGALGRHRANHLTVVGDETPDPTDLRLQKVNHIEMLEQIVSRGAKNIHAARITPELALKAVDMIYKLNAGSQLSDFMQSVTAAMGAEDDEGEYMTAVEAAEARLGKEEAEQGEVAGE